MSVRVWTDGAYREGRKKAYISYVIFGNNNKVIDSCIREVDFKCLFGSLHAELIAMEYALKRVKELNFKNPCFYSDEQNLLAMIKEETTYKSLYKPTVVYYIEKIKDHMKALNIKSKNFYWAKSENNFADKIIKSLSFKGRPKKLIIPKAIVSLNGKYEKEDLDKYEFIIENKTIFKIHLKNAKNGYGSSKLYISGDYVFMIKGDYLYRVFKNESNDEILNKIKFEGNKRKRIKEALFLYRKKFNKEIINV